MRTKVVKKTAPAAAAECGFVVMACDDMSRAERIGQRLLQMNTGILVVYNHLASLRHSQPVGRVAVVILDTRDTSAAIRRALEWIRRRWPRCPVTVVGDAGGGDDEMAAREGGASFLTRPVSDDQWSGLLSHALASHGPLSLRTCMKT